jgi:hypothetical protein
MQKRRRSNKNAFASLFVMILDFEANLKSKIVRLNRQRLETERGHV